MIILYNYIISITKKKKSLYRKNLNVSRDNLILIFFFSIWQKKTFFRSPRNLLSYNNQRKIKIK